jgi:hypothetical protein
MKKKVEEIISTGGDERLELINGVNSYGISVTPKSSNYIHYASSTGESISTESYVFLTSYIQNLSFNELEYKKQLQLCRDDIRKLWGLEDEIDIVFGPSGTDLEIIISIAGVIQKGRVVNFLSLPGEIGSKSQDSAKCKVFSSVPPNKSSVRLGESMVKQDINIRTVWKKEDVEFELDKEKSAVIVHLVYGSKTGKIYPDERWVEDLSSKYPSLIVAVDACQGRISKAKINKFLNKGFIVYTTGSKFFGGQPFSGIALFPEKFKEYFHRSHLDFNKISAFFNRSEFPENWAAFDEIASQINYGLLLRLKSSIYEMSAFYSIDNSRIIGLIMTYVRIANEVFDSYPFEVLKKNDIKTLSEEDFMLITIINVGISKRYKTVDLDLRKAFNQVKSMYFEKVFIVSQPVESKKIYFRVAIGARNIYELAGMLKSKREEVIRRHFEVIKRGMYSPFKEEMVNETLL